MIEVQGIEEFEWLVLKTNVEMKIGSKTFVAGEPFLFLDGDKGRIAFSSNVSNSNASSDVDLINWSDLRELYININSGTLNSGSLAIISRAFEKNVVDTVIPKIEYVRTNGSGVAYLDKEIYSDSENKTFAYHNGEKIVVTESGHNLETNVIDDYLMVHYYYENINEVKHLAINKKDLQGYFKMECLATIYDRNSEEKRKVLLKADKVSLQNGFNLLLGPNVGPNMINLTMTALPNKNKDFLDYRIYVE